PSLLQIFEAWQNLATWTERGAAQQAGLLVVRRSVVASRLTYAGWLQQLARGRRFVNRVLALLTPDTWYDAGSLLAYLYDIQPDFLRERLPFATAVEPWW